MRKILLAACATAAIVVLGAPLEQASAADLSAVPHYRHYRHYHAYAIPYWYPRTYWYPEPYEIPGPFWGLGGYVNSWYM